MKRAILALSILAASIGAAPASAAVSSISGRVTSAVDGAPLGDICVQAVGTPVGNGYAVTGGDGTYVMPLDPGRYAVFFQDCSGAGYLEEWYSDAHRSEDATPVFVGAVGTSAIDAALDLGGRIEGLVTDGRGAPLEGVCVDTYRDGMQTNGGSTDSAGTYSIRGLASGAYVVAFGRNCGPWRYQWEYYDDSPTFEDADLVLVTAGQRTDGVDAALARRAGVGSGYEGIAGHVRDPGGAPVRACVDAYLKDDLGGLDHWTSAETGDDGRYQLDAAPGSYVVYAFDCGGGLLRGEWYEGTQDQAAATTVPVVDGVFTTVDIVLDPSPFADVGVRILDIENVLLRTDAGPAPVQPGTMRRIHLELTNDGAEPVEIYGGVNLCPVSRGYCDGGWDLNGPVAPGATRVTFDWDGTGTIGDVDVHAYAYVTFGAIDRNETNNEDTRRHYVVVGGTGRSVDLPIP